MRVLLLTHRDLARSPQRSESSFVSALRELVDVDLVWWDDLPFPSATAALRSAEERAAAEHDVVMFFVRFRHLHEAPDIGWGEFPGMRVWVEHDAWNAFSPAHQSWHGTYQEAFRRHRFDLMVTTGKMTTARLVDDGVRAVWVPKGYAPAAFWNADGDREGVCTFGTRWPARRAMLDSVLRSGLAIRDVSGPYESLNARLNEHAAAVVCNMPATTPFGRVGRAIRRLRPGFVTVHPAVEPMIKTFEAAGSGCAPVIDDVADLPELGFISGQNCYVYSSFDELVDLLLSTPCDDYVSVGRAAAALASERHTWAHRAEELVGVLERELRGGSTQPP